MEIYNIIKYMFPNLTVSDIQLRNDSDGKGTYIAYWNEAKLGKQPTIDEIKAKRTEAQNYYNNKYQAELTHYNNLINYFHSVGLTDDDIKYLNITKPKKVEV